LELRALLAMLENKPEEVNRWMEKATTLEKSTSFNFGPPMIVKPSGELYAEWLLGQGDTQKAEVHLQEVLTRAPKRRITSQLLMELQQQSNS